VRVDDDEHYGLIEKDQSRHLKLFFRGKGAHYRRGQERENRAKTTEQPSPSPLRSEKEARKYVQVDVPFPGVVMKGEFEGSSVVYAEDGIGIGPEVDTP